MLEISMDLEERGFNVREGNYAGMWTHGVGFVKGFLFMTGEDRE